MLKHEPNVKDWDSETKYEPFNNKRMNQLYPQKGLKLTILTVFIIVAIIT
jgi:hypothetical protein